MKMKHTTTTKVLTALLVSLLFVSYGTALHNDPACTGDSAHCSQNDQIVENKEKISQLESDADDLRSDIDSLESDLTQAEQQVSSQLQSLNSDLDSVESRISDLEADSVSQSELDQVESELDSLQSSFVSERDRLEQKIDDNSEEIDQVKESTYTKEEVESLLSEKYDSETVDQMVSSLDESTYSKSEVEGLVEDAESLALERAKEYADRNDDTDDPLDFIDVKEYIVEFFKTPNNIIKEWVSDNFASQERVDELERENQRQEVEIRQMKEGMEVLYNRTPLEQPDRVDTVLQMMEDKNITEYDFTHEGTEYNCKMVDYSNHRDPYPVCAY